MSSPREWTRRVVVSMLAGSGLTAIGLGGSLSSGALAAEPPTSTAGTSTTPGAETSTPTTNAPTTTSTTTTTSGESPPTPAPETTSTPVTTPAPAAAAPTSTSTTPVTTPTHVAPAPPAPHVVVQHSQQTTGGDDAPAASTDATKTTQKPATSTTSGDIAPAPQLAAAQANALAAMLAGSAASIRALDFYRIPLFLLPIYQAAAVQYGVPWQVLAAINEVETDYGTDVSVSTAGAIGWMQFMPETWLQYGVDAVDAGYADPYNPVDAIFAAARYLHAAGASKDLHAAILAYNHSEAYVESVLLRARLIASYPASVIATLTGLTEGSLPVAGAKLSPDSNIPQELAPSPTTPSSATAGATPLPPSAAASSKHAKHSAIPGSTPAPSPAASAANAERALDAAAPPSQLSKLIAPKGAPVVAVEDGRVVGLGKSRKLGRYIVLRDTYGDVFTYGGLGSIVPRYRLPKPAHVQVPTGALAEAQTASNDPKPTKAASAGRQTPLTLHVAKPKKGSASKRAAMRKIVPLAAPVGIGKVRMYAHPDNPDAIAAAHARAARSEATAGWMRLERGSDVAQGTVLGHLSSGGESADASMRFAVRPAGAQSAIDPQAILENWRQLKVALHPQGAKDDTVLAGATASDAFLLSQDELERAVLSDPDIKLGACDRTEISKGKVQSRVLAVLVFLSRSGLKPTVGRLRCGHTAYTAQGAVTALYGGDSLEITAINGVPIAGHQGANTITDITIRTLLTLPHKFAARRIVSLMKYPGESSTLAKVDHASYIEIDLPKRAPKATLSKATGTSAAAGLAAASHSTTGALAANVALNSVEWQQLVGQIGALPTPKVSRKPSSSAIRDKPTAPDNAAG